MPKTRKALTRCPWSLAGGERYIAYHDEEWGVPVWDDGKQFEFLVLESAQAGLSWSTVLNKRDGYRNAFADFDPEKVARFTARRIEHLVADSSIIRNRQKITAAVNNARQFLKIQDSWAASATTSGNLSTAARSKTAGNARTTSRPRRPIRMH